jgi:membrane protein required for colicin V production
VTTLDLIVLAACAAGLWRGYQTGLIRQATSLVGYAVALIFALALMDQTGVLVAQSIGLSPRVAPVVGFVVVFVVFLILVTVGTNLLERVLDAARLSVVNRAAGGALGVLKAALLVSVALIPLTFLGVPDEQSRADSLFYEPVSGLAPAAWALASDQRATIESARETFEQAADAVSDALPDTSDPDR